MITTHQTIEPQIAFPDGVSRNSERTASTMTVTGFTSATGCSQPGIESTGTNAEEMNVSGKMIVNP